MLIPRVLFINKDVLALLVTLFLSALLLFNRTSPQINQLKLQITLIANKITYPKQWYNNIFVINEENQVLKNKMLQLILLNSEMEGFRLENKRLREMLNFVSRKPLNFIPANVVHHHYGLPSQSIAINIGSDNGIMVNMAVMDENGLLGKTIYVEDNSTLVQLVTDNNFRVSVRIGQDRELGLFLPTHGKYGILEGVRKSMPLQQGEIAYTSGISTIYPPNIPVARVISAIKNDNHPFQHVVVELLGYIDTLDYVFVIL